MLRVYASYDDITGYDLLKLKCEHEGKIFLIKGRKNVEKFAVEFASHLGFKLEGANYEDVKVFLRVLFVDTGYAKAETTESVLTKFMEEKFTGEVEVL